jgi:hypothetical protein
MSIAYSGEIVIIKELGNLDRRMVTLAHHLFFFYGDMTRGFGDRDH